MIVRILSGAVRGLSGELVEVEVDHKRGMPQLSIVGLGDTAVQESKQRIESAIANCGFVPPHHKGRVTMNLAPANMKKVGSLYDLPLALGFLLATEQCSFSSDSSLFLGELSLDGRLRRVPGVLAIARMAKEHHISQLYVPAENAPEAALVQGLLVFPVTSLQQLLQHFTHPLLQPAVSSQVSSSHIQTDYDFASIAGQAPAKRALEIAATGGHNILLSGPPGSGKSFLAQATAGILPSLTADEILDLTTLYSISGKLTSHSPVVTERPFRNPHHSASAVSLIGGGTNPHPGEISLAHRGVLFLDELAEFSRSVLEHLRQPLQDGVVTITRKDGSERFPCRFLLIGAMNPCPCGFAKDSHHECTCSPSALLRYHQKLSGPFLDRIDLHVWVDHVPIDALFSKHSAESSVSIRQRVEQGRIFQRERYQCDLLNAHLSSSQLRQYCPLSSSMEAILRSAADHYHFSARSIHRIMKVARTIADLSHNVTIEAPHLHEALQYRSSLLGSPSS